MRPASFATSTGRRLLQIAATLHFRRTDLLRLQQEDGVLRLMYCHDRLWHLVGCIQNESILDPLRFSFDVRLLPARPTSIALRSVDPTFAVGVETLEDC